MLQDLLLVEQITAVLAVRRETSHNAANQLIFFLWGTSEKSDECVLDCNRVMKNTLLCFLTAF